jgi:hypothetical protein
MCSIPAMYTANKMVWMMSEPFKLWLHAFDAKTGSQNRKTVLFVDIQPSSYETMNWFSCLPTPEEFYSYKIKVCFDLWNITFDPHL